MAVPSTHESFFENIRRRLGRARGQGVTAKPPSAWKAHLPTTSDAELCQRFQSELEFLGARCQLGESLSSVHSLLRHELRRWEPTRCVSWAKSEFDDWKLDWLWGDFGCHAWTPQTNGAGGPGEPQHENRFRDLVLGADVGITTVDFAIATTGTLAVSASQTRPRSVSLAPTVHVALVRASQLVPRMGDALARYFGGPEPPSAVHFISGPSRTSDIENDHTIGVHGPAAVSVLLWRDVGGIATEVERSGTLAADVETAPSSEPNRR